MTAQQLIAADLLLAVLSAAGWIGAGVAAAVSQGRGLASPDRPPESDAGPRGLLSGRVRLSSALAAAAGVLTLARVGAVVALAGHGWWFVQEKAVLALPLVALAAASMLISRPVGMMLTGLATAAGLVIGYPAGVPDALIAVAVVTVVGVVAWRYVEPASAGRVPVMGGVALAAVAGLAGAGLAFLPSPEVDAGGGPMRTDMAMRAVSDLRGPTAPAPGGTVRRYELAARQATVTLASGREVAAWTYNGQVPGPALTAVEGDLVEVRLTNVDIPDGVTLHWHGYDVANAEDGAPGLTQDAVLPGQEYVYRFLADQVGTYWYHTHQVSDLGVRLGLYGTLIVRPAAEPPPGLDLAIPVHTLEGTVVIGLHDGVEARQVVPGTPVRLRLINTDSMPHRFALADTAFRLAAVDGNELRGPGEVREQALSLAAGGRYDVTFTMPDGPVALLVDDNPGTGLRLGGELNVDTSGWPELELTSYGEPAAEPALGGPFDRDFALVLDRGLALVDGVPAYAQTVNGLAYPGIPTQHVRYNDLVRFTVVNRSMETHPWHLHGHRVLVLAKNGRDVSGSPLWMDSFDVRPGDVWQVAFRADNPGVWMNHCHNLGHADQGMALHLAYEGVSTTAFHGGHGG